MFRIVTLSSGFSHVSQIAIMSRLFSMTNSVNSVVLLRIDWAFMAQNLALRLHSTAGVAVPVVVLVVVRAGSDVVAAVVAAVVVVVVVRAGSDVVAPVVAAVVVVAVVRAGADVVAAVVAAVVVVVVVRAGSIVI